VIAYRKFSDTLRSGVNAPTPPKPPNAPKIVSDAEIKDRTLGGLGALGGGQAGTESFATAPGVWTDAQEERAAIIEHDGGAPRAWAEGFARLDLNNPPGGVPLQRWLRFIDDGGRFLDRGWAARAAALGWGPLDLFGCDRERPFARIDHLGLLWLLDGGTVLELHRDHAIIETLGAARQAYRRRPVEVGRVTLAWELMGCQK
jgi:hypothetical protein